MRPTRIKVSGVPFTIKWDCDQPEDGLIDLDTCSISIAKMPPALQCDTLLHELLHAVWFFGNLGKKEKEERVVSIMGTGVNAIFANNPELLRYVQEAHKHII